MSYDFDSVYLHDGIASAGTLASDYSFYQSKPRNAYRVPVSSRDLGEGIAVVNSLGNGHGSFHGHSRPNTSIANGKRQHGDWLADQLARRSEKEVANSTGMTPKAVGNVRQRRNKLSFDNFVELCLADEDFAASFCEYVGVLKPGEAELAGALTKAFNAYQRKQGRE